LPEAGPGRPGGLYVDGLPTFSHLSFSTATNWRLTLCLTRSLCQALYSQMRDGKGRSQHQLYNFDNECDEEGAMHRHKIYATCIMKLYNEHWKITADVISLRQQRPKPTASSMAWPVHVMEWLHKQCSLSIEDIVYGNKPEKKDHPRTINT
jgi:hypothetical protein